MAIKRTGSTQLSPLEIGQTGAGSVTVTGGSQLTAAQGNIGLSPGGAGVLEVSGAGSAVTLRNTIDYTDGAELYVGRTAGSQGTVSILSGGTLAVASNALYSSATAMIGIKGGTGSVTVDGAKSLFSIAQKSPSADQPGAAMLFVGYQGTGSVTLSHEAKLTMSGDQASAAVGGRTATTGTLRIESGADAILTATSAGDSNASIAVGLGGTGVLAIDGAGSSLTVNRTGSIKDSGGDARVTVGYVGDGGIDVTNGASLAIVSTDGASLIVGARGGTGRMTVSGAGSTVTLQSGGLAGIAVGMDGKASLTIENGAKLVNDAQGAMLIGTYGRFSDAAVTVDGNGDAATLLDGGRRIVLEDGEGSLTVLDGATVRAGEIRVGVGGSIGGNSLIAADVTMADSGRITATGGNALHISGTLTAEKAVLGFHQLGTEQAAIVVAGTAAVAGGIIDIAELGRHKPAPDQTLRLIHSDTLLTVSGAFVMRTGEAVGSGAFIIAGDGHDLTLTGRDSSAHDVIVDLPGFGASAVSVTLNQGSGVITASGLGFLQLVNVDGLRLSSERDSVAALGGKDLSLWGGGGADVLTAGKGDDVIWGGTGSDRLSGGKGADEIHGGAGNDTITGGGGQDALTGDGGADRFVYLAVSDSAAAAGDLIGDFSSAQGDRIDFSAIDADARHAGDDAFVLTGNGGADAFEAGLRGQLRIAEEDGATVILADRDGDGAADMRIGFAGAVAITAADFIL